MNKEEANRQVQELFRGTSTLVCMGRGHVDIDGVVTPDQLRQLAFIVEHLSCEEQEIEVEGPLEMIRWGGPEDHFKDIAFREDGSGTIHLDLCGLLEEMGFELPPEGSRAQHDLQEQLTALTPQFEVVAKLFVGRIYNQATKLEFKNANITIIQEAISQWQIRLRRKL